MHGHHLERPAVVDGDKHGVLPHRRLQNDFVTYDPNTGRLTISCASVQLVDVLRRTFGEVLFGDEDFFRDVRACSLDVLQEHDAQLRINRHRVKGISAVRLVSVKILLPGGGKIAYRAARDSDAFEEVNDPSALLQMGQITSATLAIDFAGKRGRRHVTLTPPDKFGVKGDETAPLIHDYLRQVGFSATPPRRRDDLWTLGKAPQPIEAWRLALGPEKLEDFVDGGVLVKTRRNVVPHRAVADVTYDMDVIDIGAPGELLGITESGVVAPRMLTPTDVEGLALDYEKLSVALAEAFGMSTPGKIAADGVVRLGEVSVGSRRLAVFLMLWPSPHPELIGKRLEAERGNDREPVLLVPEGRAPATGAVEVDFSWKRSSRRELVRSLILKLGIEKEVPANMLAPSTSELIVDDLQKRVWIRGVEVKLEADSHPYKYVLKVASSRSAVSSADILEILSPKSSDDAVPRRAKSDFKDAVYAAFRLAGEPRPDFSAMFPPRKGFHATALEPFVFPESGTTAPSTVAEKTTTVA